jgi:thioredoxin 1
MSQVPFHELIKSETPVLVDFSAEWCGPCKMLAPIPSELKSRIGNNAKIIKIDVDRNNALAGQYQIQSVPTLMIFQNGEMKWRQSGVLQVAQLEAALQPYMSSVN